MFTERLIVLFLGIFVLLFRLFNVTNFEIKFGAYIMGIAALILGVVCLAWWFNNRK